MKRILAGALALSLAAPALALEAIQLSWSSPGDMAAALAPHLRPGESASALGSQLILDASPARTAELRRLINQLDTRPESLTVELALERSASQGSASINWGGTVIHSGPDGTRVSPNIGWSVGTGSESSQALQFVRVLDGHSGYIALGQSRPLPWRLLDRYGRIVHGVEYREAVRGLYVRPRLVGSDRVLIDVAVSDDAFSGRRLDTARLSTTVEGRLGEWLTLGAISQEGRGSEVLLLGGGTQRQGGERLIRLRVRK